MYGARGWKPLWQAQQANPAKRAAAQSFDPTGGDRVIHEATGQKAYGPLADATSEAPKPEGEDAPRAVPTPQAAASIDHIMQPSSQGPGHFLRKRFSVTEYHGFEFEVPAHALHPELRGSFKSSVSGGGRDANVQVLLLDEQEFNNFARGEEGTVTFQTDPSDDGEVDWALNSPLFVAQKYFLIFRNASPHRRNKSVYADFTVSSE